jgi:uncharacterized protein
MGMTLIGAAYRPQLSKLFDRPAVVDCAELIGDRYFSDKGLIREGDLELLAGIPIVVHGLSANTSSATGPEVPYLEQIRRLCDYTEAIMYSDHVALTGAHGRNLGHLAPNRYDDELLATASRHIELMNEVTGRRPCLENLATKTMLAGSKYTPEEYYLRLLDASDGWDCLLDVTNVWINSQNRPVDVYDFIDAIPPDRIRCIHLAGGHWHGGEMIDSHSQTVHEEVWPLLEHVLERSHPDVIMVERDSNWDNAEAEVRDNLATARRLVEAAQAGTFARAPRDLQATA